MSASTKAPTEWLTDWDVARPIALKSARVGAREGEWTAGLLPYFEYRSLDLDKASSGKFGGWHVRAIASSGDWQADDVDFHQLFVLKGTARVAFADGSEVELHKESSLVMPPLYRYRVAALSEDFEALHIVAPAEYDIVWGEDVVLPQRAATLDPQRTPIVNHDDDASWGPGLREFFEYRDLGTLEPTDGRAYVHVVRAAGQPFQEGTGWHYHSWAQMFIVLGGYADIRVETSPRWALSYGDAYCIGAGPTQRHFVDRVTADYKVIELCVPGWKDATPVDAPEGSYI
ncbi:cupin domain-containing protein [Agrococcus baldri]|uniref:Cupin domain-containing protein n=1 Tax=Agrococcus baldri TaxID=153730 RepID=A0AA87URF0_9MICO|nr:hypothetical protein [Agrococcus baldri]GEK79648.1 hypothetical protein ABA31_09990 [Agrococcus baldri]